MQDKFINKKSNKEIVMLVHIMLCYKPKLIKTLKHWNLIEILLDYQNQKNDQIIKLIYSLIKVAFQISK